MLYLEQKIVRHQAESRKASEKLNEEVAQQIPQQNSNTTNTTVANE